MAKLLISIIRPTTLSKFQYCLIQSHKTLIGNQNILSLLSCQKLELHQKKYYSDRSTENKELSAVQKQEKSQISEDVKPITFNKVKETTKTVSYLGVILIGVGVTGIMFFTVFSELFSSKSPNNVYSKALKTVCDDSRVQDALGEPLSGYGEENRRGRRQHVSHLLYMKDGEKRLRMKFYVSGSRKRATVHLEMRENESGNYEYRYLFVELDDFGRHPIVIEDNRLAQSKSAPLLNTDTSVELDLSAPLNMNLNFPDGGLK